MLGATRTSGPSPSGISISGCGTSKNIGPVTSTWSGQRRGYSSCGNVATRVSSSLNPLWSRSSGGNPTLALVSLYSSRP